MHLKVIKADGSVEEYLHTKVIGTFGNALALVDDANIFAAEQFAEAVTFYLYEKRRTQRVTSEEIHLMMQAVLSATGYEHAACALNEHRLNRKLRRNRVEVVEDGTEDPQTAASGSSRWDKAKIVRRLVKHRKIDRQIARAIAGGVEEKALNLNMAKVPGSLVEQLVLADTDAMLAAQKQLQTVAG
ncbi:MAG: hypothetical protein DRP66_03845 [Planctomycetota bacterium]|nr:MAG: hypothetical protein DRP66_03845 [Planctomycetota bacterium]